MLSERAKNYEMDNTNDVIKIKAEVIVGNGLSISNTIIVFADKEKMDLIGNIGLSGMSKVKALGSVSRAITERFICPVLVVH
jgi:nucleotide-binding universal stress UspA family protein